MILSASRRTDIPNYYSEWFYNRIKEGFLYVRNPMNPHQISKIRITPDVVDCIAFWTKNPENMMERLEELKDYNYYFQFTLTGYETDVEPELPDKWDHLTAVFQTLSGRIGHERMIWRYDPILLNERYTIAYHEKAFQKLAGSLNGYTDRVVISFLDLYAKTKRNTKQLKLETLTKERMYELAERLSKIAGQNHMRIETCAEQADLHQYGVNHGSCIDKGFIEEMIGCRLAGAKDKNQRKECGCLESIEVGAYNTCKNGCRYCYANFSDSLVNQHVNTYHPDSPLLCGAVGAEDIITERKVKSLKEQQLNMFDLLPGGQENASAERRR